MCYKCATLASATFLDQHPATDECSLVLRRILNILRHFRSSNVIPSVLGKNGPQDVLSDSSTAFIQKRRNHPGLSVYFRWHIGGEFPPSRHYIGVCNQRGAAFAVIVALK